MKLPDWKEIDTLLLDMDGTLLDLHFDNYFWLTHVPTKYAEKHGISFDEAHSKLTASFAEHQGTLNWYCLDFWTDQIDLPIVALKQDLTDKILFRPHTREFLAALRNEGKRLILTTNAHRGSLDLKVEHTRLDELVDRMISSHDYGLPKEHQGFWDALQQDEPFDPTRTLLIDDSQAVLESAAKWGIGWLLTIYHPDSQRAPNTDSRFPGVHHFDELNW